MGYSVIETLSRFFPVQSVAMVRELSDTHHFHIRFKHSRATKLGDFRPSNNGTPHLISINADMNIYACLLIFLHELAHLLSWDKRGRNSAPHGKAWKETFGSLIRLSVRSGYFHPTINDLLIDYSYRVKASGMGSELLVRALRNFDNYDDHAVFLADLPDRAIFMTKTGRMFCKGEQIRKRFKCFCPDNRKTYIFHPMSKVHNAKKE